MIDITVNLPIFLSSFDQYHHKEAAPNTQTACLVRHVLKVYVVIPAIVVSMLNVTCHSIDLIAPAHRPT